MQAQDIYMVGRVGSMWITSRGDVLSGTNNFLLYAVGMNPSRRRAMYSRLGISYGYTT